MKLALLVILLVTTNCYALTDNQKKVLQYGYEYGNTIKVHNQGWGETIASIIYQETKGGSAKYKVNGVIVGDKNNKNKPKSLGVMQVQLPAARDVQRWYPNIFKSKFKNYNPTDEELIYALLSDYKFNIRVGSWYFIKMLELKNYSWRKAILAYNAGANYNGIDRNNYVQRVLQWREMLINDGIIKGV